VKGPRDFDGSAPEEGADDEDMEAEGEDEVAPVELDGEPEAEAEPALDLTSSLPGRPLMLESLMDVR
jgi:hypothetical protein